MTILCVKIIPLSLDLIEYGKKVDQSTYAFCNEPNNQAMHAMPATKKYTEHHYQTETFLCLQVITSSFPLVIDTIDN